MTWRKTSLIAAGFTGSMALGVWMAPYVTDRGADTPVVTAAEPAVVAAAPAPASAPRASLAEREARETTARVAAVAPSSPELQARLKPVFASGTDVEKAAAGFDSSEQFAVIAHLARNTGVPFVLLKHRVLDEGRSLTEALTMSNADVDARLEVNRARAAARADIWSVG